MTIMLYDESTYESLIYDKFFKNGLLTFALRISISKIHITIGVKMCWVKASEK